MNHTPGPWRSFKTANSQRPYGVDGKLEWTNAAIRRLGGVLKTLEAAMKEADKNFIRQLMKGF